jgi:two-component system response regulator DevR
MKAASSPRPDKTVRIALMCENPIVYRSLGSRLAADPNFEVVGTFDCLIEKVLDVLDVQPHVALLGISHITHFNMLVCAALREANPAVRVVVLPSFAGEPSELEMAYTAGAAAVMLKSIDTPALVDQIRKLVDDPT